MNKRLVALILAAIVCLGMGRIKCCAAGQSMVESAAHINMNAAAQILINEQPPEQLPEIERQTGAEEQQIQSAVNDRMNALDTAGLQSAADRLLGEARVDVADILERLRGGNGIDTEALLNGILNVLAVMLRKRLTFVIAVTACAAIAGAASHLCGGSMSRHVGSMACLCACAGLLAGDFAQLMQAAADALEKLGGIVDALLPLISGVMAATGAHVTGGLLGGVAAALAGAGMRSGREYISGMIGLSAALELCSGLHPGLKLGKTAELMRTLCGLLVGAALVLVLGVITVNGSLGVQVDSVTVRATRYALDNMVPVVGGEIKDTVGVMAASCVLVQNLLGTCGMLLLLLGASAPVLNLAAGYISYKLCAALAQTLGTEQLSGLMDGFARVVRTLMISVLGVAATMIMLLGAFNAAARSIMQAG